MEAKVLEIRDRMTFIAALAVEMKAGHKIGDGSVSHGARAYLLKRCGYPADGTPGALMIMLTRLDGDGMKATADPYAWGDRTFKVAHKYITANWNELRDGDVVDVEFILGETEKQKRSERDHVKENR